MLVIGYSGGENDFVSKGLDIDLDTDSPQKIFNLLRDKSNNTFDCIVCIEDDQIVASFYIDEDYDASLAEETDDNSSDDEDVDPDDLHENDNDDFNEDDDVDD